MGGKKPIGSNVSRGGCHSLSRGGGHHHSSGREESTAEQPLQALEEFSIFSTLPWLMRAPSSGLLVDHQQYNMQGFVELDSYPRNAHQQQLEQPPSHHEVHTLQDSVRRIEEEVSGMSNRLLILENAYAEDKEVTSSALQRLVERVSTIEGRQSAVQSKVSQLDNLFGSSSQNWTKGVKVLKEVLSSASTQSNPRSPQKKGFPESRSLDSLQAVANGTTLDAVDIDSLLLPAIPHQQAALQSECKSDVDYPVSKRELYAKMALISESINSFQMEIFDVVNRLSSSLDSLDNKILVVESKISSDTQFRGEEKDSDPVSISIPMVSLLSLNRVGQHSYVLKSYAADMKCESQHFNSPLSPYSSYIDKILEKERRDVITSLSTDGREESKRSSDAIGLQGNTL